MAFIIIQNSSSHNFITFCALSVAKGMDIIMKALVLESYKNLVYRDVPRPEYGSNDLLVKVKACGICGSDVHGFDGSTGRRIPPIIMGHEAAGIVENVGSEVKEFKIGDRITFDSTIYCGSCPFCLRGQVNLCDNREVLGVSCKEYKNNGAFAEYVSIPQHIAYNLPENVSFEEASMTEPASVAFHAVKHASINSNDNVVVVGCGTVGLLIIQVLNIVGCDKIIAVDIAEDRLKMAEKLGATHVFADIEVMSQEIGKLTGGVGADVAFEVVGINPTFKGAIMSLRKGGALVNVGNLSPQTDFPLQFVVTREISIQGSCASAGEYDECLDLIADKKLDVSSMINAVVPLEEGASWFNRLYKGEAGLIKVVLKP